MKRTILCLLSALLFGLCACSEAEIIQLPDEPMPSFKSDIKLQKQSKAGHTEQLMLYYDGLLFDKAILRDDIVYVAPDSIGDYYGLELNTEIEGTKFYINSSNLVMSGDSAEPYIMANYRYIYNPEGFVVENSRVYFPKQIIEKVFGLKLTVYGEPKSLEVSSDGLNIIKGGADYYEINYGIEDLFWLPRIIYAESKGQPFEGLIGVGNVVYNRVEHELFPNTVFEVIFDSEYAVQFTPAATGAVMDTPDERSLVAACLCLEGYNTVGESLYFVNPKKGDSRWFREELDYICTIGDHDFYGQ